MAATTLPRQDIMTSPWHEAAPSQSLPSVDLSDRHTAARKSPNRVKSKPANPTVISSILTSLETLEPPSSLPPNTYYSSDDPRQDSSRPMSPSESFASAPSVPFSAVKAIQTSSFHFDSDDDLDEDEDDTATPPVIATSRSPSGLSHYSAVRTSSYGIADGSLHPPSIGSRSSSYASSLTKEKVKGSGRKLSAESWVKQNAPSQDSLEPRRKPYHLRRISSHDTLRQSRPDQDFQVDQNFILDGLGHLATDASPREMVRRTPRDTEKVLGKSRLFIKGSVDEPFLTPRRESPAIGIADTDSSTSERSRQSSLSPATPPLRNFQPSKPSPISDSIPLRTSSLRLSSSPASSKRRARKQNGGTSATPSSSRVPLSEQQEEDTRWADLGENDETVRRILELRKKRETRLIDLDKPDVLDVPRVRGSAQGQEIEEGKSDLRIARPGTGHSTNEPPPPTRALRNVGLPSDLSNDTPPLPNQNRNYEDGLAALRNGSVKAHPPNSFLARAFPTPDVKLGPIGANRPMTAKSTMSVDPPLLLEYSYAHAVDALQGAERDLPGQDIHVEKARDGIALNGGAPIRNGSIQHRRVNSQSSVTSSVMRSRKNGMGRWHPRKDSYDEPEKRGGNRRKSMSDARNTRYMEEEPEMERRDSVDDAVLEYLHAPRFNQRVPNAHTGRIISFSEVGDPNGAAVIVCVGMGLTRFVTAFYDELATTLRLRLITIERPGVGNSEPYPPADKSGPLNWPDDVLAVCEHLGISKFSMLAHSAGAVYALATALILPHFVRGAIHLLGPWIPPSQLEAPAHSTDSAAPAGALPRSQRLLRVLPTPFLKAANSSFMTAASSSLKPTKRNQANTVAGVQNERASLDSTTRNRVKRPMISNGRGENPRRESLMLMDRFMPNTNPMENFPLSTHQENVDMIQRRSSLFLSATATPSDPNFTYASTALNAAEHAERERQVEFTTRLTQRTWEYAIRDSNPATDLLVCLERNREIGFRYTDVARRVIITHGSEDKRVPMNNVKWLADQMNRAALHRAPMSRDTFVSEFGTGAGCEVRILENEGHGLMALPTVMSDLLTEIAGYWTAEERGRAVQLPW